MTLLDRTHHRIARLTEAADVAEAKCRHLYADILRKEAAELQTWASDHARPQYRECPVCYGSGEVERWANSIDGATHSQCRECEGAGEIRVWEAANV